jgi:flavin-dependent dehydrogenase
MIRRDEFDTWLAGKTRLAGIEVREGVSIRRVQAGQHTVLVTTDHGDLQAAVVVGADGSNGITRRCVLPSTPIHTARLLEVLAPGSADERRDGSRPGAPRQMAAPLAPAPPKRAHEGGGAYFDFLPVPRGIAGYTWDFPTQVRGEPMRCWGIYDTNLLAGRRRPPMKDLLAEEMARHGFNLADHELQGHPIRLYSPFGRFAIPRVILVGDAAGADAIFGEGISIALGYGYIAAQAIRDACASNDFSFRDYGRRIRRSPLGRALAVRAGITVVLYHLHWSWFQRLFWRGLRSLVILAARVLVLNWARRMRWPPDPLAAKA